ncbi:unnamed protein product [Soboliphyme baturini]|uniref:CLASP_N domain-containing protein n=1 Tax=Soboliphyme baturini TaxID=241478 RepID=A0A183J4D5_9BILA|nr:unnamed protein product [Soboliphyme baturini]
MADPFPPVRIAAILAMSATQQFYSSDKIAKVVLPLLCCRTVDPEKQIREHAFRAIKGYLEKLEKFSQNPELAKQAGKSFSREWATKDCFHALGRVHKSSKSYF